MSQAPEVVPQVDQTSISDPGEEVKKRSPQERNIFLGLLSLGVTVVVLVVSYVFGNSLFTPNNGGATPNSTYLIPYATCLAGILLFIMGLAQEKGETWAFRNYWGEHAYRVAQAFAYLFVVLWAWGEASNSGVSGTDVPPNILGFLVGLFILRVERAMDGLGDKLEEVLSAVLPRAVSGIASQERNRRHVKAVYDIDDLLTKYEVLRSKIEEPAARAKVDERMAELRKASEDVNCDLLPELVDRATMDLEEIKQSMGEITVPLSEILSQSQGAARVPVTTSRDSLSE